MEKMKMGRQATLLLLCTLLWLAPLSDALCPRDSPNNISHGFRFYGPKHSCDGTFPTLTPDPALSLLDRGCTACCKNFLSCLPTANSGSNGVCTEVYQGMTCQNQEECGKLTCQAINSTTSLCLNMGIRLENGARCYIDEQCQSSKCLNSTCQVIPTGQPGGAGCSSSANCAPGTWCNLATGNCTQPLSAGQPCDASIEQPNWVCEPGSGCLSLTLQGQTRSICAPYSLAGTNRPCNPEGGWWNCQYGLVCGSDASSPPVCMSQPDNSLKTSCRSFPFTYNDFRNCPNGATCDCFSTQKREAGHCAILLNTNCLAQSLSFSKCLKDHKCPHESSFLIGGDITPFAGPLLLGSCADVHCRNSQASLINCQNVAIASPLSPAFAPTRGPAKYVPPSDNDKLEDWQTGLIIIAGADGVLIILTVLGAYLVHRFSPI